MSLLSWYRYSKLAQVLDWNNFEAPVLFDGKYVDQISVTLLSPKCDKVASTLVLCSLYAWILVLSVFWRNLCNTAILCEKEIAKYFWSTPEDSNGRVIEYNSSSIAPICEFSWAMNYLPSCSLIRNRQGFDRATITIASKHIYLHVQAAGGVVFSFFTQGRSLVPFLTS